MVRRLELPSSWTWVWLKAGLNDPTLSPNSPTSTPQKRLSKTDPPRPWLAQFIFSPASFCPGQFVWTVEVARPPGFGLGQPERRDPPGDAQSEPTGAHKYRITLHFGDGQWTEKEHD